MFDVILDTLLDILKLLPFLFFSFLLLECFEHKWRDKSEKIIKKAGKFGPLLGSLLGLFPQCGFGVVATHFFVTRIISLGTLISIYLATSDEMLPVLIAGGCDVNKILWLLLTKFLIGLVCGCIIDLCVHKKEQLHFDDLCEQEHCDCSHGILKSSVKHTVKTAFYLLLVTFCLNFILSYLDITSLFLVKEKSWLSVSIFALVGLIPNCGASIAISQLYNKGIIAFGQCLAGLLTNSGVSLLVLFKVNSNKKENIFILLLLLGIAIIFGIIFSLFS